VKKVPQDRLVDELFMAIGAWLERGGRVGEHGGPARPDGPGPGDSHRGETV